MRCLILSLLCGWLFAACRSQSAPLPLTATPGDTLTVAPGEAFTVPLPSRSGAGYKWMLEEADLGKIRLDSIHYDRDQPTPDLTVDKDRYERFNFTALGTGREELRFYLRRSWEPRSPLDSTRVTVVVVDR